MPETMIEIVLSGMHIDETDWVLAAECAEIAAVEAEARATLEALEVEPTTTSVTSLPQLEAVATSVFFEA